MKNIYVLLSSKNSSEFFECYCIHVDHAVVDSETLHIFLTCILSIKF